MHCTSCGTNLEREDVNFCGICGARLQEQKTTKPEQPTLKTSSQPVVAQTQPTQPVKSEPIVSQQPQSVGGQRQTNNCPTCNQPLTYNQQNRQWYCYGCKKYPYQSTQPTQVQPQGAQYQPTRAQPTQVQPQGAQYQPTRAPPTQVTSDGRRTTWQFYSLTIPLQQLYGNVQNYFTQLGYNCSYSTEQNSTVLNIEKGSALWKGKIQIYFQGNENQLAVTLDRGSKGMAFFKGGLIAKQMQEDIQRISQNIPGLINQYCK